MTGADNGDRRLLVLAPTAKDGAIMQSIVAPAGIPVQIVSSCAALIAEMEKGAAAALVAEEVIGFDDGARLARFLSTQPPWSDFPMLVLARQGAESVELSEAVRTFGNVTLIERPVRIATLLSAINTAVRARERQYQIRGHLAERARAEHTLRAADQRKDEFLATLGHELRNPLAPLLTGLHLLQLSAPHDPVSTRACAVMERQISHLVRLVDDLLEVSRITRGVIDIQREPLDLRDIVRAAVETSRPIISAATHKLHVEMPETPVPISGDAVRLTQVFANLLNNAAKYTNAGGHIAISVRVEDAHVVVLVRDDGIGIEPRNLASVFDMFTQVDRSNRRTQGGLGIGLTLVRSLVGMHGGTVAARSGGSDHGSEFEVRLPLAAEALQTANTSAAIPDFGRHRILIVDDNRDAADSLAVLLTAYGAQVSVAYNGRDALEQVESFAPDITLLDIGMPAMDGYEVARRIRAGGRHEDMLLIALTGWGQEKDRRRSRGAGIDHHLVKPLDVAKLKDLLLRAEAASQTPPNSQVGGSL
jgi:signal transduction histidine kinase/ActR/RegA family two-component response regulator